MRASTWPARRRPWVVAVQAFLGMGFALELVAALVVAGAAVVLGPTWVVVGGCTCGLVALLALILTLRLR